MRAVAFDDNCFFFFFIRERVFLHRSMIFVPIDGGLVRGCEFCRGDAGVSFAHSWVNDTCGGASGREIMARSRGSRVIFIASPLSPNRRYLFDPLVCPGRRAC